jgi:hypothetical protein
MAVTLATFRARFPEFGNATDGQIQAELDEASVILRAPTFGVRLDEAILWRTAHRLSSALMGLGGRARVAVATDEQTVTRYAKEWERIVRSATVMQCRVS